MKIKVLCGFFILAGLVFFGLVTKMVRALDTAAVAATVTVQNIGVATTVSDGSVAYGAMAIGTSKTTLEIGSTDTEFVINTGNIPEKFRIIGANTTGCVWGLGAATGVGDTYVHQFSANRGTSFTPLTLSYQDLVATIGVGITQPVDLMIKVPTSSSCYTTATAGVTILAEAI